MPPEEGREGSVTRFIIERYKRSLFSRTSSSLHLKTDLLKLTAGSKELIDLDFGMNVGEVVRAVTLPSSAAATVGTRPESAAEPPGTAQGRMCKCVRVLLVL